MILRARRLVFAFAAVLFLGLGGLAGRIAWVQAAEGGVADARLRMLRQSTRWSALPAVRGRILDRFGSPLAISVPRLQLWIYTPNVTEINGEPRDLDGRRKIVDRIAGFLAPRVDWPRSEIARRLVGRRYAPLGGPVVEHGLMVELEAARNDALALVDFDYGWARRHPGRTVAGNVVGFVDHAGSGVAGVERGLEDLLQGIEGKRFHRVDVFGRPIHHPDNEVVAAMPGCDVKLTIDTRLQGKVERILAEAVRQRDADGAACAVMEVLSGDLLVLASVPLFDAADRRERDKARYRHRAVEDLYAPGSTIKPLMMAAALDLGLVSPEARIDCSAAQGRFGYRTVVDTKPQDHPLNPREILIHSSNIGMARIMTSILGDDGRRDSTRPQPVFEIIRQLGFGASTGLPLPFEPQGQVPRVGPQGADSLVSVAYGYALSATVVQMAAALATLADGHRRMPRLVQAVLGADGRWSRAGRSRPRRVFSRATVDLVRDWMVAVMGEGSSRMGLLDGVLVAGKTGTAVDERDHTKENHSFAALLPADAPRYAVIVLMQDPQGGRYSSQTTVPVAREILREILAYEGLAR